MATAPATDGRTARSQRTRIAVVDALLALLAAGNPRPTAREIAAQAGVSLRSVYVHFDDLDDLFIAASERQVELVAHLLVEVPATGPLADRAERAMRVRERLYEQIGAVLRAAERQEPFSPALAERRQIARRLTRRDLERIFARELDRLAPAARERTVAILETLTSSSAWSNLRANGLSALDARTAVTDAIVAVVGGNA